MKNRKDMKNAEKEGGYSGLERRRRSRAATGSLSRPSLLSSFSDWLDGLTLSCQRYSRSKQSFAVAEFRILEYLHVLRNDGASAAESLKDRAENVMRDCLRNHDMVCWTGDGQFLVLLSDTAAGEARNTLDRLARAMASSVIGNELKKTSMSSVFKIATPEEDEILSDVKMAENSPRDLLRALSYDVDGHGHLKRKTARGKGTPDKGCHGNFEVWLERYQNQKEKRSRSAADMRLLLGTALEVEIMEARDSWRDNTAVTVKIAHGAPVSDVINASELIDRAQSLQDGQHAGLTALVDFFLLEDGRIFLVEEKLRKVKAAEHSGKSERTVVELLLTVLDMLIFMQALSPDIVPAAVAPEAVCLRQSDDSPVFDDYELVCLFPDRKASEQNKAMCLKSLSSLFGKWREVFSADRIAAHGAEHRREYDRISAALSEEASGLKYLSTLNRTRVDLKRLQESLKREEALAESSDA